jgi:hypothetical protein
MFGTNDAAGMAALTIAETMLLLLIEKGVLTADDIGTALDDTAQVHRDGALSSACELTRASHLAAVKLIENVFRGSNLHAATPPVPAE